MTNTLIVINFILIVVIIFIGLLDIHVMKKHLVNIKARIQVLEADRMIPDEIANDIRILEAMVQREVLRLFPDKKSRRKDMKARIVTELATGDYTLPWSYDDISYVAMQIYKQCLDKETDHLSLKEQTEKTI